MKNIFTKTLFMACAVFLLSATPVLAQTAEPFDFKGVKLGISIDEFRKMPHPDADDKDAHYAAKESAVVCTGEKVSISANYTIEPTEVMLYDRAEQAAGVVKCVWVNKSNDRMAKGKTAALSLADSGYAVYDYSFSFIPDPKEGVLRFYRFVGETNRNAFGAVEGALAHKFGKPIITQDEVQNGLGNRFTRTMVIWRNSVSEIFVTDRSSEVNKMVIIVSHKELLQVYEKAVSAVKPLSKNPI